MRYDAATNPCDVYLNVYGICPISEAVLENSVTARTSADPQPSLPCLPYGKKKDQHSRD